MELYIAVGATVIIVCLMLYKGTSKIGVPMLLAFMLLGMLFSENGPFKLNFSNINVIEKICTTALIFIMFYGGFGTNWKQAKPVSAQAILLSSVGVVMTTMITGLLIKLFLNFGFIESFLIGAVIGSTDAASVFNILRSKKLNLRYHTASLLEVESGSNDPFAYILTILFLTLYRGEVSVGKIAYLLFSQVVYGGAIGVAIAFLSMLILKKINFMADGFDTAFVVAVSLISYALPALIGGNGYLSCYIVGIILGNSKFKNKKILVHFFDGLTSLTQILIFFLLGVSSAPALLLPVLLPSFIIFLIITFIARPAAVAAIMLPFKSKLNQLAIVSWSGLRGASSIVFSIVAATSGLVFEHDIFHIVFCVVLFSITLQGSFISLFSKRLKMIDTSGDVLKTFNDYTEENEVQFIELIIAEGHPWVDCPIKSISVPQGTIVALIIRSNDKIIPKGNTKILQDDILVLGASSFTDKHDIHLTERKIDKTSEWLNKKICEISLSDGELIVLIKRGGKIIIPQGKSVLTEGDVLVLNTNEES